MLAMLLAMGASLVGFSFPFSWLLVFFSSLISALSYLSFPAEDATRDRQSTGGEWGCQPGCTGLGTGSSQPGSMCGAAEGRRGRADGKND